MRTTKKRDHAVSSAFPFALGRYPEFSHTSGTGYFVAKIWMRSKDINDVLPFII